MSEMVERVARALAKGWAPDEERAGARDWKNFEYVARIAIEAMREPAPAMLEAGARAELVTLSRKKAAGLVWRAMIDEALKP